MQNNKAPSSLASREKPDPGFVKIRRGLEEHLHSDHMSSNGTKLYLWLQIKARWNGESRGTVETDYDTIARRLGWASKMVQRTVRELAGNGYIKLLRAANQHEVTLITILKFDGPDSHSGVDTGVQCKESGVDAAVDRAVDTGVQASVHSNPANQQKTKVLEAPKKVIEVKKEKKTSYDEAVGRPEETATALSNDWPLRAKSQFKNENIKNKILGGHSGGPFHKKLDKLRKDDPEFLESAIKAFDSVGWNFGAHWRADDVAEDFVMMAEEVWEKVRHKKLPKSVVCSKIIDECESNEVLWPPSFQEHRDWLREREK